MATHNIKITQTEFDPSTITVSPGDKVMFKLHQRTDPAFVTVSPSGLFPGDNPLEVGPGDKEKVVATGASGQYDISANSGASLAGDQLGGKIIVTP